MRLPDHISDLLFAFLVFAVLVAVAILAGEIAHLP